MKTIASLLVFASLLWLMTEASVCAQNVAGDVTVPKDVGERIARGVHKLRVIQVARFAERVQCKLRS